MKRNPFRLNFLLILWMIAMTGCGGVGREDTSRVSTIKHHSKQKKKSRSEIVQYRDLAYPPPSGVHSDLATLDLFRLNDQKERPLVLLVHGGSWAGGDKKGFEPRIVPWWIEQGYVVASVNFRLASKFRETPVVKPRDQVRDLAAALSWLMTQSAQYHIARQNVVILGYSSGAHLVALLGTNERFLRNVGLKETQVAGVISLDVHAYDVPYALELMKGSVVERNIRIIHHLFGRNRQEQLNASPIHYVDGWAAPALIVSVDQDPQTKGSHGYIVSSAAKRYVAALKQAGHQATHIHDINETHSSMVNGFGQEGDRITQAIKEFLISLR